MKRFLLLLPMVCALPAAAHDDPVLHAEHLRLLNEVVPDEEATIAAVQSGAWSDPATWGGDTPTRDSRAIIPEGVQVLFDVDAEVHWLKIQGRLTWTDGRRMAVETIVVDTMGGLEIGRPNAPVVDVEILFSNPGRIVDDWTQLGRGLLVMGECSIWGREKTPWLHVADNPRGGDSELVLEEAPVNWAVGDRLVIPGTKPPRTMYYGSDLQSPDPDPVFREQHEVRRIAAINGNVATLDRPLKYDLHYQLPPGKLLAVGNLTRSVVLRSQGRRHLRRGHIMFMPPAPTEYNIGYCTLKDLGRTTAREHVTDPQMADGAPIRRTLWNPRGRYSLHFHKMGYESHALVEGVAIDGALKWAMSNHGSNVDCVDCVSFNCEGSNFNTENGTEIGSFDHNLGIYAKGYGQNNAFLTRHVVGHGGDIKIDPDLERLIAPIGRDLGFAGYGLWLQGPLVSVTNNEIYGAMWEGIAFLQDSLEKDADGRLLEIPVSVIPPGLADSLGVTEGSVPVASIPYFAKGNFVVGSHVGIGLYTIGSCPLECVLEDDVYANCVIGLFVYYTRDQRRFRDTWVYYHPDMVHNQEQPVDRLLGFDSYAWAYNATLENCRIENYLHCIRAPEGSLTVTGDNTLLRGANGITLRYGRPDSLLSVQLPASAFQAPDAEVLRTMFPTSHATQPLWKIAIPQDWATDGEYVWQRPAERPLHLYLPGQEPDDAFFVDGVQSPVSETPPE